jgi:hypothetical protein
LPVLFGVYARWRRGQFLSVAEDARCDAAQVLREFEQAEARDPIRLGEVPLVLGEADEIANHRGRSFAIL